MNIIYITNDFPPADGGMEINAFYTAKYLNDYFNIRVITNDIDETCNDYPEDYSEIKISRYNFGKNYFLKNIHLIYILFKFRIKYRYNYILLNTWSPFGLSALVMKYIFNTKYFITAHGLDILNPLKSKKYTFLMKIVLKNAVRIFPVSNYTKSAIIKNLSIKSKKLNVIPNGINEEEYSINYDKNDENIISNIKNNYELNNSFVLITVSRIVKRKGHKLVLEALKKLLNEGYNIKYLIIGKGEYQNELKEYIEDNNLHNNVIFTGYVPYEKLKYYYYASDLFVMPSYEIKETGDVEGFGISYLEANITGVPVIGYDSGGVSDVIKDGINGNLLSEYSNQRLAEIIKKFIDDKNYYNKIKENCKEYVRQNYLWKNNCKYLADILKRFNNVNLLYLTHRNEIGGGEISLKETIININNTDINSYLAGACSGYFWEEINDKYEINFSPLKKFRFKSLLKLSFLIKSKNINILHCNTTRTVIYAVIANYLLLKKCKIVWHNRGTDRRGRTEKILSYFVDKMIAISEAVKDSIIAQNIKDNKVVRIYNGIDFKRLDNIEYKDTIFEKRNEIFYIGILGRLTVEKNHITLLKAFNNILKNKDNFNLVIAGDDKFGESSKKEIFEYIKDNGLEYKIIYITDIINLKEFFERINLLILPSQREAFGRVIIEAMYYKVPVIASAVDGIKEIIINGENGLLYEPYNNVDELYNTVMKLYNSHTLQQKIIQNGYNTALKFNINKNINDLVQLYYNLY